MPSRRKVKPPPSFAFVTLKLEGQAVSWLKVHSGAVRSHAAYWGGPMRRKRQEKKRNAADQRAGPNVVAVADEAPGPAKDVKPVLGCFSAPNVEGGGCPKRKNALTVCPCLKADCKSPRHIELDSLQYLPPAASEIAAASSRFLPAISIFKFLGDGFVNQFLRCEHEDYSVMFISSLLISYAHSMALTGQGTKKALLELKGNVFRCLSAKMRSSSGVLSPHCLTAILALATPIVSLVSQDLPYGVSLSDYLNASMRAHSMCCQEFADAARRALHERVVHRRAMRTLFADSNARFRDADSLGLLRYVSNCVDISTATDSAYDTNTPLLEVGGLFPPMRPCASCSIPNHWASPLTCQWHDETSTTHAESKTLLLAGLVHKWLATFLDGDSREIASTDPLLERRAILRQRVERFLPMVAGASDPEGEAMYECCRWASLILLAVERLSIPMYVAARQVRIQPRLVRRLRMTDLSNLWGKRKGLLFWVAGICHFSTAGQCFPLMCTTIFARISQEIAISDCCEEVAIKPLKRLKTFESLCCRPRPSRQDSHTAEGASGS